jgi:hypothetical protein
MLTEFLLNYNFKTTSDHANYNYLCSYDLWYSPAHNVLDACISITRGSGRGGGWALEFESFLGSVKWHRAVRRVPFGPKKHVMWVRFTLCTAHRLIEIIQKMKLSQRDIFHSSKQGTLSSRSSFDQLRKEVFWPVHVPAADN